MGVFWGLTITSPKKAYTQKVTEPFHISMAALDSSKGGKEPVSVFIQVDGSEFLVCTLQQGKIQQQTLDLNFGIGDEVGFYTKNEGNVHLTGYTEMPDEEDSDFEMAGEEDWEDDDVPVLQEADFRAGKKRSMGGGDAPQTKKAKQLMQALEDADDDDSEDDEDWEDDEEEDENDDTFEDESDEEEEEEPAPVMNSSSKKKSAKKEAPAKKETLKAKAKDTPKAKAKDTPKAKGDKPKLNGEKTPKSQKTPQGKQNTPEKGGASEKKSKKEKKENATPKKSVLKMGVVAEDLKQGHGPEATPGRAASVYYRGCLSSGKQFDACLTGKPFKFKLGKGEVIKGWDLGVSGMKVGGRRRITVPPSAGYGSSRTGPIPANSTLVFDVELKAVN